MASVLALSAIDRMFEPWSGPIQDNSIGISCFSTKHAAWRSKSKDWLAWNQNNVSEWSDMSNRGQLFQWASTYKNSTRRVGLEQSGDHHHFIENNLFSPWYSCKIAHLVLNNNHSLTELAVTCCKTTSFPFLQPWSLNTSLIVSIRYC